MSSADVEECLKGLNAEQMKIGVKVLAPYLDSINSKMNSLRPICNSLDDMTSVFNEFYENKIIEFNIHKGLRVRYVDDNSSKLYLDIEWLSSGEKQLLFLFCQTILARSSKSILLLDEPELSLNVKWQRKFLDAMLKLDPDGDVQIVIASHSIEMISDYMPAVNRLTYGET